jgi:DNA-binding Lrp family transcriptional regulator
MLSRNAVEKNGINEIDSSPRGKDRKNMNRLLASVNIFVEQSQKQQVVTALSELNSIEEVYEVAGEYDIVSLVSASCLEEFRDVLQKKIMKIKGIRSTITTIILEPHKGPKCPEKNAKGSTLK